MNNEDLTTDNVEQRGMGEILSEKYLSYALSTIMSRSLPDVRDGLKPVHRRLLFAMHELKLDPKLSPKKCARVVGDVIGKFHPHGDQSVYDALVRLAQDFSVRYPLIDGQGNFGNIDGDNAAAMRYTESRLTEVAMSLLEGIDEDAIDYRATYDGETMEPVVFPAAFPNLLANGSSGIAVGMATNIPPHNADELCQAMEAMIDGDPSVADLVEFVSGPDFPTGGTLVEDKADIVKAYETGKGSFRVRSKWFKEDMGQGTYQIVVTEIPYQVQKSKLIEKIADLINSKKIPMLDDVCDESAEDIRLVLIPKNRNVEPEILMEALYRNCDLETRFSLNMNVLDGGRLPRVMDLKDVLRAFLDHRQEVLVRRSNYRLGKVKHRIEVLDGYLIAYLNLDEVIRIIRFEDHPKAEMMKVFGLTDVQAEAILNMRLRSLRKLEEVEIRTEYDKLCVERDALEKLIKSEARQWTVIRKQIQEIRKKFGKDTELGARRTDIGDPPALLAVPVEAMIEKEPITVICSKMGWIRAMKGHAVTDKDLKYKDGDKGQYVFPAYTTDKILVMASNGRVFTIGGDKLPAGRGFGEPIRLMVELPNDCDIVDMKLYDENAKILMGASTGHGFVVAMKDVLAQTKTGKQVLNVGDKAQTAVCHIINDGDDHVAVIGTNRKFLVFPLADLPEMGRGKGVIMQKYKGGALSDLKTFKMEEGLSFHYGSGERTEDVSMWAAGRATVGKLPPNGFPKKNKF
ncbi:MAG: DNA topoisomerase IV subunit A [Alphaproteobacteria bacterium]|nr:MAG: DNA topoisomerase IV subunit A [Alphaproteobacteria bacterium]